MSRIRYFRLLLSKFEKDVEQVHYCIWCGGKIIVTRAEQKRSYYDPFTGNLTVTNQYRLVLSCENYRWWRSLIISHYRHGDDGDVPVWGTLITKEEKDRNTYEEYID